MAWQPLGWKAVAFSEIEPFPCAVLAHHYPDVPNWGDMTNYKEWPDANVDLLCGGTPCQSFSVAGLRKGLDDPRGDLMLTFGAIADKYRPRWLVWENVPGVLSSNGGRDFGTFLVMLGQLGYGFAYRVLDAQHFGVPQRRRRVFVVGYLGDWRRAAAVLFERHSMQGNTPPSREAGQGFATDVAPSLTASGRGIERIGETRGQDPVIAQCLTTGTGQRYDPETETILPVAYPLLEVGKRTGVSTTDPRAGVGIGNDNDPMYTLQAGAQHGVCVTGNVTHTLRAEGFDASEDGTGRGQPIVAFNARQDPLSSDVSGALDRCSPQSQTVAVSLRGRDGGATAELGDEVGNCLRASSGGGDKPYVLTSGVTIHGTDKTASVMSFTDICGSLRTKPPGSIENSSTTAVYQNMAVRRLTVEECELLQGFPRSYTLAPHRGKPAADGPRYKALGNSWAVPVARWIGERIQQTEELCPSQTNAPHADRTY